MNPRIVSDLKICGGEASIKGTRIPVRIILSHLAAGETTSQILEQFPNLVAEDVKAALEYAAFLASERAA